MTLESFVTQYGCTAVFIGTILEGETVVLIAAVLVQQGFMEFQGLLLTSAVGAFVGDQFFFHLGRCKGARFLKRYPSWQRKVDRAVDLLNRRRGMVMLFYRFIYGMRAVIPYLLGAGQGRVWQFTVLSALSAVLWAAVIGIGGYYFGAAFQKVLHQGKRIQQGVILGLVVGVILALVWRWWKNGSTKTPDTRLRSDDGARKSGLWPW